MIKEYLAVDNVCAWPNLTLLGHGDIIATFFNQPCHGKWEGCVECWVSKDQGVSWKYLSKPIPNEPKTNRMNHATGIAHNKDLIFISSGWSNVSTIKDPNSKEILNFDRNHCSVLNATVARSSDHGLTWTIKGTIEEPKKEDGRTRSPLVPYGDIFKLSDKTLACCFYNGITKSDNPKKHRGSNYLLKSHDDGRTWQDPVKIGGDMQNETFFYPLSSKNLIAASRSFMDGHLDCFKSYDEGNSWEHTQTQLSGPSQAPGHILKLRSELLLLTYGIRYGGLYGLGARWSEDHGEHWSRPCVLTSMGNAYDGGYPSTVELENGQLVTAYYSGPNETHGRYHMKTVHWTIEDVIRKNKDLISKINEQ